MSPYELDKSDQSSTKRDYLLRVKLAADIEKFEQQLTELKNSGSYANFADIQAHKELIQARQEMLKRLK